MLPISRSEVGRPSNITFRGRKTDPSNERPQEAQNTDTVEPINIEIIGDSI